MNSHIPYGKQFVDDDDIAAIGEVLKSDFLTQGPKIKAFEDQLCEYTGARYCVAVSNGTAALHLAVKALGISEGCEGITTPITFVASANALIYNNLRPVFADIDQNTYCIDPKKIRDRITEKTKVVVPVHFAGRPCNMDEISMVADKFDIRIIEDAAHAIGSQYTCGAKVGSCKYSDMTIFSFHPVKTMTTGEGGAITTNSPLIYNKLKMLITHGITKDSAKFISATKEKIEPWYYEMQMLGFNYRITDIQCALGMRQLEKLDGFAKKRLEIVKIYNNAFKDIKEIVTPCQDNEDQIAYHLYVIQVIGKDRLTVFNKLLKANIGVQVHYIPVHLQPYYQREYGFKKNDYPVAEDYYAHAISLPLYPKLQKKQINYIINSVKTAIEV